MPLYGTQQELIKVKRRYLWMMLVVAATFLIYAGRLFIVQVKMGEEYRVLSRSNFISARRHVALRGMIFDRNHHLLADNRPSFNLYFTPAFCKAQAFEPTLSRLTEHLGLSDSEIDRTREHFQNTKKLDRFLPLLVRRDMSWAELAVIEQNTDALEGIDVRPETRRAYPQGTLAPHLLGYVSEIGKTQLEKQKDESYQQGDVIGKAGVEMAWEDELRGKNGELQVVVDARGQTVPENIAKEVLKGLEDVKTAVPGANLVLSMDSRLQALAEKRFPGEEGAAIAIDAKTGFILAAVSRPGYDPNVLSGRISRQEWKSLTRDPNKPLTNRFCQQHYPPGSTFKPFTGMAALESGGLTPTTPLGCSGGLMFGGRLFRCWRGGGHGSVDLHRALVQSCDVFFYQAGIRAGIDQLAKTAKDFGFGEESGFREGREVPGIIPNKAWYTKYTKTGYLPGFILSDSIGQGDINVTLLQLANGYATIANGGTLYRPQLVLRLESAAGEVLREFGPEVRRTVAVSPANLQAIFKGLVGVANEPGGTAYWRRPQGVRFQVGGKTGTAQVVRQGDDRGKNLPYDFKDHAWFVGFAPVDDPQIAVAVVNEHGGHGGSAAAPLVMEMITYYLEQLNPKPTPVEETKPKPGPTSEPSQVEEPAPSQVEEPAPSQVEDPAPSPTPEPGQVEDPKPDPTPQTEAPIP